MARKVFKTVTDESISLVDNGTGEILGLKRTKVCSTQEEFIKVYLDQIGELTGCLEDGLYSVMFAVWKCSKFPENNYEGNYFNNNLHFKDTCRDLGIKMSDAAINTAIYRLEKRGVIRRIARGEYILNPRYFAKGNITQKTRMEICIRFEGKTKKQKTKIR